MDQRLSRKIEKAFGKTISRVLLIVAIVSFIITMILVNLNMISTVKSDAKQYATKLDVAMEEKMSMINSIAGAISSGTIEDPGRCSRLR